MGVERPFFQSVKVLAEMPERLKDGENYAWVSFPGGEHAYNCWALRRASASLA